MQQTPVRTCKAHATCTGHATNRINPDACTACGQASCRAESLLWICLCTYQNGHLRAVYGAFELPDNLQAKGGTRIKVPAAGAIVFAMI